MRRYTVQLIADSTGVQKYKQGWGRHNLSISTSTMQCHEVNDPQAETKYLWTIWDRHPKLALDGPNNILRGWSWAALRTNFVVSGKLMLDAGLSSPLAVDYIFLTHGHSDHAASLYFNTLTPVREGEKRKIYMPVEIKERTDLFLQYSYEMGNEDEEARYSPEKANFTTIGVQAGEVIDITHNGKPYQVRVYENDHSVPCRSYGFCEFIKSLKDEYRSLEGRKLGELRRAGVNIEDFTYKPRFIYIGDTCENVFVKNPEIFEYKSIIVECTFLYDDDMEQANATKHCHWRNLR